MKHTFFILAFLSIALTFNAYADDNDDEPFRPWAAKAEYLSLGKAKFEEPGREGQRIKYGESHISTSYIHRLNDDAALTFDITYQNTNLEWKENPSFSEENHPLIKLSFGGTTKRFDSWEWSGSLGTEFNAEHFTLSHYTRYKGTMWGRYALSDILGIHIGFTGEAGLRKDSVLPILGIDYKPHDKWKLKLVFPMDISAIYSLNKKWSLAATGRSFKARHRLSAKEANSKGIFTYRSYGSELSLNYNLDYFLAKVFAGSSFGGDLKIMDKTGKNPSFYKYRSAVYFGGNVMYEF